ncbi:TonB family protein [Novosphingobium sp.]|uniref:TonB family protein n=1 Tax=Novosphingobium sp. TaxID=1874826 RepID=UPI0038BC07FE
MVAPVSSRYAEGSALQGRTRGAIGLGVLAIEALLALLLVRGLAGDVPLVTAAPPAVVTPAINLPDKPQPPEPPRTTTAHEAEGAQGASGRKAAATQTVAPPARLPLPPSPPAAPAAGTGDAAQSGAGSAGVGTGGAGAGNGPGSGGNGAGAGGRYVAVKPVKIAGDLTEADYPREGRAKRLGTMVIVVLSVASDGRASACRVHHPSGDPAADAITCRLAVERFRFRPAQDQNGAAIAADYGWQQRFFYTP